MKKIKLETPQNFSFKSTVYSHGWSDLLPFKLNEGAYYLRYTFNIYPYKILTIKLSSEHDKDITIELPMVIDESDRKNLKSVVKRIFRLDEDFSEFYSLAENSQKFNWIQKYNAGRMLRSANLWEDMVKMLCTTNCTWRLTQIMTENLVTKLGGSIELNGIKYFCFPQAEIIADQSEIYLRNDIKMGYRAPYLLAFAQQVANGHIDLNEAENKNMSTSDLYKYLRSIKGFGDYAVSNLLKLLGRYDFLGADSWSRQKFIDKRNNGKKCNDKKIEKFYTQFGKWSGLFFWMDVSEDWYQREQPW
jgi:N-glycosylase/DNA lyase